MSQIPPFLVLILPFYFNIIFICYNVIIPRNSQSFVMFVDKLMYPVYRQKWATVTEMFTPNTQRQKFFFYCQLTR